MPDGKGKAVLAWYYIQFGVTVILMGLVSLRGIVGKKASP